MAVQARVIVVSLIVVLSVSLVFGAAVTAQPAQEAAFSLVPGQWITLGSYAVQYHGLAGAFPAYDLYYGNALIARFPPTPRPPNTSAYGYQNVSIFTLSVAPDGSVTGVLRVQ